MMALYPTDHVNNSLADEGALVLKGWTIQSPHLNIIKQMGTEFKRIVCLKNPHNLQGVCVISQLHINAKMMKDLYSSFPRQTQKVI